MITLETFYGVCLAIIAGEWLRRAFWMAGFSKHNAPIKPSTFTSIQTPKVSVIVPAKNEEKNISNCLDYLVKQDYPNYEIIVVNDRSTDRTQAIVEGYQQRYPSLIQCVKVESLPDGWSGKNHAMVKGFQVSTGQWLLFTDADTTHSNMSLSSSLQKAIDEKIDYLTLAPETECRSFWEHVVQPLAVSSLALWFQADQVNQSRKRHTLSNGQFILIKREVYIDCGTNESVKKEVVEDVEFAKKVIEKGYVLKFLNGTLLYKTRMYSNLTEIKNGWTRIFTYLFEKNTAAIWHKIFLFVFFSLFSFMLTAKQLEAKWSGLDNHSPMILNLSIGVCGLIILLRAAGNKLTKTHPVYAVFHPLGSIIMVWILLICIDRIKKNRPSAWKGDLHH